MKRPRGSLADRFAAKVEKTSTCWVWQGATISTGYGSIWSREHRRCLLAHRVSYELSVGPIPDGLQIDHLCRNRLCVNPAHLEPVTSRENLLRGFAPSAVAVRTGLCARGHMDWRVKPNGKRECRTCHVAATREWRKGRRASLSAVGQT